MGEGTADRRLSGRTVGDGGGLSKRRGRLEGGFGQVGGGEDEGGAI